MENSMKPSAILLALIFLAFSLVICSAQGGAQKQKFIAETSKAPDSGTEIGVVYVISQSEDGKPYKQALVKCLDAKTAQIIAQRAQEANDQNERWYIGLTGEPLPGGDWVLTSPYLKTTTNRYLVRLDRQYIKSLKE